MGGFASGPGGVAAWLAGIPWCCAEQNAAAGLTNRLLAHLASRVLLGFAGAFEPSENVEIVGNPVRSEVLALAGQPRRDAESTQLRLLIIGGSLGAPGVEPDSSCSGSLVGWFADSSPNR